MLQKFKKKSRENNLYLQERYNHCQVQINDCEVAFIGGITGTDVVSTETVAIWNFEEHTWRAGPK